MNSHTIAMIGISTLWFLSEVLINILTRSKKSEAVSYDKNSISVIWIVILVSITIGIVIAFSFPRFSEVKYFSGILLILIGIAIRFIAIFSLKSYFNANVAIHHDHKLKTDGIYKKIRHPSYSGSLITSLGLGLTLGNWISLLIIVLPIFGVFLYRIKIEEKALTDNFKKEYLDYQKRTKKLIPYVF
jgi:protein-S-isoprenylcysteine O-methyltransferase Ste14